MALVFMMTLTLPSFAQSDLTQRAKQKVGQMCNYITLMADKTKGLQERQHYCQQCKNLFLGKCERYTLFGQPSYVKMEVTSLRGTKFNYKTKTYFNNIVNMIATRVDITFTSIADMRTGKMQKIGENEYTVTVYFVQKFRKFQDGRCTYIDETQKTVTVYLKKIGEDWKVQLENTEATDTTPLPDHEKYADWGNGTF